LLPPRFEEEDFFAPALRLFDLFAAVVRFPRDTAPDFRDFPPRALAFDRREIADFFAAPRGRDLDELRRELLPFDFEEAPFRERPFRDGFAADLVCRTACPTAFLAVGNEVWPPATARPARAPSTPPTTVPTGPATLPSTAPVAAPAVCFEIGGISMFSDPRELPSDLLFSSSAISFLAPVGLIRLTTISSDGND
jgi:hypothetical protein